MSRSMVSRDEAGHIRMRQFLDASLAAGVAVMNIAVYDTEELRKAKQDPDNYRHIVVRVWGFSARFVDLADDMQDHIISRVTESAAQ